MESYKHSRQHPNIDQVEQQLQEDLIKQTVELQDFYEDDLSQYTLDDIKPLLLNFTALARRTWGSRHRLTHRRTTSSHQDTLGHPTSTFASSVHDIEDASGPLKARFVAKGYSQYISDHIKETFEATPSSTALRTLLLHVVLHQYYVNSRDISSTSYNHFLKRISIDLKLSGNYIAPCVDCVHHPRRGKSMHTRNSKACTYISSNQTAVYG